MKASNFALHFCRCRERNNTPTFVFSPETPAKILMGFSERLFCTNRTKSSKGADQLVNFAATPGRGFTSGARGRTGRWKNQEDRGRGGYRGLMRGNGDQRPEGRAECHGCGSLKHLIAKCLFRDQQCRKCSATGHIAKMCKAPTNRKVRTGQRQPNYIEENPYMLYLPGWLHRCLFLFR